VIVGVGRLTRQKDFPTLLQAFALVCRKQPSRLVIFGEGRGRAELVEMALQLGVQERVDFPGFVPNPYKYLQRASLFVLSSAWEGSPNVLTEALSLGIPVVATDCPSGPREILQNGLVAPLVPVGNPEKLATAMLAQLTAPQDKGILQSAVKTYNVKESSQRYLDTLLALD
jgi:glycosyltransferase involved in cell wall biosynthesis